MNTQKLKIAFLGNQIAWGGGAKSLLLLIKVLSKQNFKLYLFVTNCSSLEMRREFEKYVEFVKLVNLPELVSAQTRSSKNENYIPKSTNTYQKNVTAFINELNNLNIDILHINNSVFSEIYISINKKTNVKIITHLREWIAWNGICKKQEYIIDKIKHNSDALISISETEAKPFKQHSNLHIIANPFDFKDIDSFNRNDKNLIKSRLGLEENSFIVGMVGSFQRSKGALDFIKALAYLKRTKKDVENIKFVIVGGTLPSKINYIELYLRKLLQKDNFKYDILKFLRNNSLTNDVLFLPKQKGVLEISNCFDVAVRPSLTGDPWGRDIIEYMALKKAIVATGSSQFFIKNGETGYLVPPKDHIRLAEIIYFLFQNNNERTRMGKLAYNYIYSQCNLEAFEKKLFTVYNSFFSKND